MQGSASAAAAEGASLRAQITQLQGELASTREQLEKSKNSVDELKKRNMENGKLPDRRPLHLFTLLPQVCFLACSPMVMHLGLRRC